MTQILINRRAVILAGGGLAAVATVARFAATAAQAQTPGAFQSGTPPRIGIIGSGRIGSTIGTLWVKAGHPVLFSSRRPEELKELVDSLGPLAQAGTVADAAAFGDVVLLAVPYAAMPQLGRDLAGALTGKVVMDATNASAARDGEAAQIAQRDGIGTASASFFPGARLVRGFNTINYQKLAEAAHRPGQPVAVPLAGDDQPALATASALVRDAGFDPVVVGPLARAKDFAAGTPVFLQLLTADELRQRLQTSP